MLPLLVAYGVASSAQTLTFERTLKGFQLPAYAIPVGGQILVSEIGNKRVVFISQDGVEQRVLGNFDHPTGLAATPAGDVFYVGQQGGQGLQMVGAADGQTTSQVGAGSRDSTDFIDSGLGVVVGGGMAFVADVSGYRVQAFDAALTRHIFTIDQGTLSAEFKASTRCTTKAFDPQKGFQGASCFNPHGLAWRDSASGGRLYVADADNDAVLIFNDSGEHLNTIRDPEVFKMPRGVAITPRGRLLIAERTRVLVLTLRGKLLQTVNVPTAMNMLGIACDSQQVYIADVTANAIFVLSIKPPSKLSIKPPPKLQPSPSRHSETVEGQKTLEQEL